MHSHLCPVDAATDGKTALTTKDGPTWLLCLALEALLVNAETMARILTVGQKVRIVTQVKNKGSRTGNNEAMFVGGVTTSANEYRGRVPVFFQKIVQTDGTVGRKDFDKALDVAFKLFLRRPPRNDEYESYWNNVFQKNA